MGPLRRRLAGLDLHEHEDKILLLLALVISAVVGLTVVAFVAMTEYLGEVLLTAGRWQRVLAPLGGSLVGGWLLYKFFPDARGSGIPQTRVAMVLQKGVIGMRTVVGKFVCSSISLGSGVALGREGPSVQIGAGIASAAGRRLGLSEGQVRSLIPVGTAAAVAAAFNTPLAAVLFTLEEILADLHARVVGTVVIGAATSWMILRLMLGDEPLFHVPAYQLVHPLEFVIYALLGLAGGLVSTAFVKLLLWQRLMFRKLPERWQPFTPAAGGLLVGLMALAVPGVLGVGYNLVSEALNGQVALKMMLVLLVVKLIATTSCYGSGNAGGIFGPSLFVGAMLGGAVGQAAHTLLPNHTGNAGAYALVGMGVAFAGIVRTPMTSVIMIFETTRDYTIIVPLMLANMISFVVAKRLQKVPIYEALTEQDGITMPSADHRLEPLTVEQAMRPMEGGEEPRQLKRKETAVHPDDPLDAALQRMGKTGVEEIPVVSRIGRRVVGVVGTTDVLAAYRQKGRTQEELEEEQARNWLPALAAITVATVLLVPGLMFWQRSRRAERAEEAYKNGEQLLAQGLTEEAVQAFRTALSANAGDAKTQAALGLALVEARHYAEAPGYLNAAMKAFPRSGPVWTGMAEAAAAAGDRQRAMQLYRQALTKEWTDTEEGQRKKAQLRFCGLLAKAGRKNEAVSHLLSMIEQSGDDAATGKEAARMVREVGSAAQAEAAYTALAGHFPADAGVWMKLGEVRFEAGREPAAREAFRKAAAAGSRNEEAERALARTEEELRLDPTRRGLPVRERARRWDEILQRVYAAAAACGSSPEMEKAKPLLKRRALSLEASDQKMEAAVEMWKATGERCRTDAVVAHILAKLGE